MVDYKLLRLRAKFRDFYNKNLIDDYRELENKRKKFLRLFWIILISSFVIINLFKFLFLLDGNLSKIESNFLSFLCFIAFVCSAFLIVIFKVTTQNMVMGKIISFFGDMEYGKNRITDKDIEESELIGYYTNSDIDDSFFGKYNDVAIKVSEQKLIRKSGKNSVVTVFNGIFVMLDFDKKFSGKTLVINKFRDNIFTWITGVFFIAIIMAAIVNSLPFHAWGSGLLLLIFLVFMFNKFTSQKNKKEEVKLEDVVFSKKWKVYATDQIEARYLLTTAFMERILEVKRRFKGKSIEFSFFDNKLFIAISTNKDMFETTSLFKSALRYDRIQNVVYQFYSIFSIIDLLKIKGTKENETN